MEALSTGSVNKISSHYWGYRELSADEIMCIGGGDGSEGNGSGEGQGDYGDSNGGSDGGAGTGTQVGGNTECRASDTTASCNARTEGYAACDALGAGLVAVADAIGNRAAQNLAGQVAPACRVGVDNIVDAAYRTEIYEGQQSSVSPSTGLSDMYGN